MRYAPSVGNSSTGNCPNWDAHLAEGILLEASWEVLLVPAALVALALDFVPFATGTLLVCDLLQWLGVLACGLHPLRLGGGLERRMAVGQ